MIRIIIAGFMIALLSACGETVNNTAVTNYGNMDSIDVETSFLQHPGKNYDIEIYASCWSGIIPVGDSFGGDGSYFTYGFVRTGIFGHPYMNAGVMTICNLDYESDETHGYYYGNRPLVEDSTDTIDTRKPEFGKISNWGISGDDSNNLSPFKYQFYAPSLFNAHYSGSNGNNLNKNYTLALSWDIDKGYNNDIWLILIYDANFNRKFIDGSLPAESYYWYKKIKDTGHYEIEMKNFSFQAGSNIFVYLIKSNELIKNVNGRDIHLCCLVESMASLVAAN